MIIDIFDILSSFLCKQNYLVKSKTLSDKTADDDLRINGILRKK